MFKCAFDWCSLWNGFLLGVISSIIATVLTNLYLSYRTRKRFNLAVGKYVGYGFEDEKANPLVQLKDPQSKAQVCYIGKNLLRIQVEHGDRKWDGDIAMEHETFGTVVWKYIDYPKGQHSFGFKRVMVREESDEVYLYLVGEWPFGKELFIRPK